MLQQPQPPHYSMRSQPQHVLHDQAGALLGLTYNAPPLTAVPDMTPTSINQAHDGAQGTRACQQCKRSKVRCTKSFPCVRCTRLGVDCTPQPSSRPPTKARKVALAPSSPQAHIHRDRPPAAASRAPPAAPHLPLDRGIGSSGYSGGLQEDTKDYYGSCAQAVCRAFSCLKAEGKVDDSRAMSLIRMWGRSNHRRDTDVTLGAFEAMLGMMGPYSIAIPVNTTDPNVDPSHQLFDNQEGNSLSTAHPPPFLIAMEDHLSAVCGYICDDGEYVVFTNSAFSNSFLTNQELQEKIQHFQILPEYAWSSIFHPGEIKDFFVHFIGHLCSRPQANKEMSSIFRCVDRHGQHSFSLVRVRHVVLEGGRYSSLAMSILPVPQLRHLYHITTPIATQEASQLEGDLMELPLSPLLDDDDWLGFFATADESSGGAYSVSPFEVFEPSPAEEPSLSSTVNISQGGHYQQQTQQQQEGRKPIDSPSSSAATMPFWPNYLMGAPRTNYDGYPPLNTS